MRRVLVVRASIVAILLLSITGCEPKPGASKPETRRSRADSSSAEESANRPALIISAAASTKEIVEKLAADFTAQSGTVVRVNLGSSNQLASQILEGAPADLFLSASREWSAAVRDAQLAANSVELLTNKLVIVVPEGNPASIQAPADLVSTRVRKIALAGENVPAGKYADQALSKLDLLKSLVDSQRIARGQDVRAALSFVERGEVEAGIVYSTDVAQATGVEQVYRFDPSEHDAIVYVLVLLQRSAENSAAREFYEYLQSPAADSVYDKAGFQRWKPRKP